MAHICKEFLNITTVDLYPLLCQSFLSAGWTEHYTISSTSRVFKSLGSDDLQPPIYIHIYIVSGSITFIYYAHWSGSAGVLSFNNSYSIISATSSWRLYINKSYFFLLATPYTSQPICMLVWPISPLRIAYPVQHAVTGGSSVTLTLSSVENLRLNEYRNIYGVAGEGQQEIRITNINTDTKTITVTGCTNNYSSGALVGDYIVSWASLYGGNLCMGFPYNRLGASQPNGVVNIVGKTGNVGAAYTHENYIIPEIAILTDSYRYFGEINSTYIKTAKGSATNDIIQIINNDDPIVDSLLTSFTTYTLTDTTKNWAPDSLIGKICVFISGTGSGYTRYIIGNTANTLTFRTALHTVDLTTGFRIADEVYRSTYNVQVYLAVREEF